MIKKRQISDGLTKNEVLLITGNDKIIFEPLQLKNSINLVSIEDVIGA